MEISEVSQGVAEITLQSPKPGPSGEQNNHKLLSDSSDDEEFKNHPEPYQGQIPLTKEHKNTIFEILRCAVCLEIPRPRPNLQVKSCENGHHFCSFCREQLKNCAICRGKLFAGRNFVVEELINKLGKPLGILRHLPKKTDPPFPSPRGKFQCPHCNDVTSLPAKGMLHHIRNAHKNDLVDNLRTNPYTAWFFARIALGTGKRRVCSFQVSDLGLISVTIVMGDTFQAWLQLLADVNRYKVTYRMNVTNEERVTRGVTDVSALPFSKTKVPDIPDYCTFPIEVNDTEKLEICFLVQRADVPAAPPELPFFAFETSFHPSDRASRRSRARNRRRRRNLREKIAAQEKAAATAVTSK